MTFQWATRLSQTVVFPGIFLHHAYWRRKVVLDRILERRSASANVGLGCLFGLVGYFGMMPLRAHAVDETTVQLNGYANDIMAIMRVDPKHEFPGQALMRIRDEVITKTYIANDRVQIKRSQAEAATLKETLRLERIAAVEQQNTAQ